MKIMRNLILCTVLLGSQALVAMKIGDKLPQDMIAQLIPFQKPQVHDIVIVKQPDNTYSIGYIERIDLIKNECGVMLPRVRRPVIFKNSEIFMLPSEKTSEKKEASERIGRVPESMFAKLIPYQNPPYHNPKIGDIVIVKSHNGKFWFGKIADTSFRHDTSEIIFTAGSHGPAAKYKNSELFMLPEEAGAEAKESVKKEAKKAKKERAEGEPEEEPGAEEEEEPGAAGE